MNAINGPTPVKKKIAVALALLGLAAQADAALTLYSSEAAFTAATLSLTTIDFNGIAAAGSFVGYGSGPLTLSGVTFTNAGGSMFVIDPGYYSSSYAGGGFLNSDYAGAANVISASLGTNATAIGLNFGGLFSGTTINFTFNFSDGSSAVGSTTQSIQGGSLDFIGFTSTVGISSVSMTVPDAPDYNAIDNFRFGTAVPEPGTLALLGLGLAGLAASRRRKQ